jgi:hypothetical protein
MRLTALQAAEKLGVKPNVLYKMAADKLVTNFNTDKNGGAKRYLLLDGKEVNYLAKFYRAKGKEWKKGWLTFKNNGFVQPEGVAIPTKASRTEVAAKIRASLDRVEAAKNIGPGIATRLAAIEQSLSDLLTIVARLEAMWK